MKSLTLTQPWATLVATGDKRIETRSWPTSYRGPLAIHAAKGFPGYAREFCYTVAPLLAGAGYSSPDELPLGVVVATCQIVACQSTDQMDLSTLGKDRTLGDFGRDRFAWGLEDVVAVTPPVPARGSLGLWEWDNEEAGVEVVLTGRPFA